MAGTVFRYSHWEGLGCWQFKDRAHWIEVDTVFKMNSSSPRMASVNSYSYFIKSQNRIYPVITAVMVSCTTNVKGSYNRKINYSKNICFLQKEINFYLCIDLDGLALHVLVQLKISFQV